jgi:hypothetical protein
MSCGTIEWIWHVSSGEEGQCCVVINIILGSGWCMIGQVFYMLERVFNNTLSMQYNELTKSV